MGVVVTKVVIFVTIFYGLVEIAIAASSVCEGLWRVDVVGKCENPEQYPLELDVKKRKLNRTHDGFSIYMKLDEEITTDYQVYLESYEKCDGGYKLNDIISGGMCDTLNYFTKENFQDVLTRAGIDPPDCPIPKGTLEVRDYVINYEDLPEQSRCGDYKWYAYIVKDNVKLSCITTYSTFTKKDDDED